MFKLFSNKNGNTSETADSWSVGTFDEDGKPLIVRVNNGLKQIAGKSEFVFRVGLAIPFLHSMEDGMPSGDEHQNIFWKIEDELFKFYAIKDEKYLNSDQRGLLCATLTGDGMKEFILYAKNDEINDLLNILKAKFPGYLFSNYVELDKKWDGYKKIRYKFGK